MGRCGEIWGEVGRYGEIWGDTRVQVFLCRETLVRGQVRPRSPHTQGGGARARLVPRDSTSKRRVRGPERVGERRERVGLPISAERGAAGRTAMCPRRSKCKARCACGRGVYVSVGSWGGGVHKAVITEA